jgi:hypothetical protein
MTPTTQRQLAKRVAQLLRSMLTAADAGELIGGHHDEHAAQFGKPVTTAHHAKLAYIYVRQSKCFGRANSEITDSVAPAIGLQLRRRCNHLQALDESVPLANLLLELLDMLLGSGVWANVGVAISTVVHASAAFLTAALPAGARRVLSPLTRLAPFPVESIKHNEIG